MGTLARLVLSPLWFLLVFVVLTAATPLVARLHPLWPLAVVVHIDLMRFGLGGPAWLGSINVVAGWLVPYCLGASWARGGLRGRRSGWVLLAGGTAATTALVLWGGYPAAMVGVPGAGISNLNPPTLAAVCFGLAQCGAALLLRGPLRRALRRPAVWAPVALLNLSAMTVFLWHQTAMLAVVAVGLLMRPTAARSAHRARRLRLGARPAGLAAGVRGGAAGVLGRVPYVRTGAAKEPWRHPGRAGAALGSGDDGV